MSVVITINTSELSAEDVAVVQAIAAALGGDAPAAPAKPVAAAPPKAASKPAPAPKAETPAEEPEVPEIADEPSGRTVKEAVTIATQAIAAGKTNEVREALKLVGAKKVGELAPDKVEIFLSQIEG